MSTLIKAGQVGPILRQLTTVDLADHLAEADAIVDRARRHGAQIVAEADRAAARAVDEAKKAGYQAGYDAGYRRGEDEGAEAGRKAARQEAIARFDREHSGIVAVLSGAIHELESFKSNLRIAAQRDLLGFAVFVARKLTFEIGRLYPEAAAANLERMVRLVGLKSDLTIRVHPTDLEATQRFAESLVKQAHAACAVKMIPDESLAPGGCTVRTDRTECDATLETLVDEMVAILLDGGRVEDRESCADD